MDLLEEVNKEYVRLNLEQGRYTEADVAYMAPELLCIPSNQVKALINVMQRLADEE